MKKNEDVILMKFRSNRYGKCPSVQIAYDGHEYGYNVPFSKSRPGGFEDTDVTNCFFQHGLSFFVEVHRLRSTLLSAI